MAISKSMKSAKKTTLPDGNYVESWWDRRSRNWISQLKDSEDNEISSEYSGNREGMEISHKYLVENSEELVNA